MKLGLRTTVQGSPTKTPVKRKSLLSRAKSFSFKPCVKSVEASPVLSKRSIPKSFSAEAMSAPKPRKSDVGTKLPGLYNDGGHSSPRLAALKLPKTEPPAAAKAYTIKKRFADIEKTLERIPSEDWLGSLLYSRPDFTHVLEANLQRCKKKLSKLKLVQAAISEEDGDHSERNIRELVEETA